MSLRDLMDISNFSFLLPFDEKLIADALAAQNNSAGFGDNFLEKILDERLYIEPPTMEQISSFFMLELQKYCPFIKNPQLEAISPYLPKNPRKLKALVRSMRVFKTEAHRHREGEIDWNVLFFTQLIKNESEKFYRIYVQDTFYRKESEDRFEGSAASPWIILAFSERNAEKSKEDEKNRITGLLNKAQVVQLEKRDRLIELCEGWRSAYGWDGMNRVMYVIKLLNNPDTITWAEFDNAWEIWSKNKSIDDIEPWIDVHAEKIGKPKVRIVEEFITTLFQKYDQHLEFAGSVPLYSEQEKAIEDAKEILSLINALIQKELTDVPHYAILEIKTFSFIFEIIKKWLHFNVNASDQNLRLIEREFLKQWVSKATDVGLSFKYAQYFKGTMRSIFIIEHKDKLVKDLCNELQGDSDDILTKEAINAFKAQDGIAQLIPYHSTIGIRDVLMNVKNIIWTPEECSEALNILATATIDPIVQKNALAFLDLLHKCTSEGTAELKSDEVKQFYQYPNIISAIWNASIATPLQFRRLQETRQMREFLISMGVSENVLTTPKWLLKTVKNL